MAQYKNAMDRIFNVTDDDAGKQRRDSIPDFKGEEAAPFDITYSDAEAQIAESPSVGGDTISDDRKPLANPILQIIQRESDFILNSLIPVLWTILFVILMDRDSVLKTAYMPLLGLFAAILANAVPIGGGIVYVPALAVIGAGDIQLGVSFSVAVMTFGNGIFGFLKWLKKKPEALLWESFPYTVIPSSLGSIVGILYLPAPEKALVKLFFSGFCLFLGLFVIMAVYKGGIAQVFASKQPSAAGPRSQVHVSSLSWFGIALVSFFAGLVLVPNIGVGPALTTYLCLALVGYDPQAAVVTGIITGGWVSLVPFLIHFLYFNDVPFKLWLMVLPGVFFGAKVSNTTRRSNTVLRCLLQYHLPSLINSFSNVSTDCASLPRHLGSAESSAIIRVFLVSHSSIVLLSLDW
jgi:uncharacterized membrane protein YfcA